MQKNVDFLKAISVTTITVYFCPDPQKGKDSPGAKQRLFCWKTKFSFKIFFQELKQKWIYDQFNSQDKEIKMRQAENAADLTQLITLMKSNDRKCAWLVELILHCAYIKVERKVSLPPLKCQGDDQILQRMKHLVYKTSQQTKSLHHSLQS